ncbi:MAG: hypothetical protein EXS25_07420 [Pedosphaera sp.]|nr:hypothetical protein [Pedosphaera sp.]
MMLSMLVNVEGSPSKFSRQPQAGLTYMLLRIPDATKPTLAELLPWNWKPAKARSGWSTFLPRLRPQNVLLSLTRES